MFGPPGVPPSTRLAAQLGPNSFGRAGFCNSSDLPPPSGASDHCQPRWRDPSEPDSAGPSSRTDQSPSSAYLTESTTSPAASTISIFSPESLSQPVQPPTTLVTLGYWALKVLTSAATTRYLPAPIDTVGKTNSTPSLKRQPVRLTVCVPGLNSSIHSCLRFSGVLRAWPGWYIISEMTMLSAA